MSKISLSHKIEPFLYSELAPGPTGSSGFISYIPFKGKNFIPSSTVDKTTISSLGSSAKFAGGVLAPNGKIYCIPRDATYVLIIDPQTDTIDTTSINGLSSATNKWSGGAVAPNGKIYCCPASYRSVLIIDPDTNEVEYISITDNSSVWFSACVANGKIYCSPFTGDSFLVINPSNNTHSYIALPATSASGVQYGSCVFTNGKIYVVPVGNTLPVLILNPVTDTIDNTSIVGTYNTLDYTTGCRGQNGKLYFPPLNRADNQILVIDPSTNGVSTIVSPAINMMGCVLGMDGKIYCMPQSSDRVVVINSDGTTSSILTGAGVDQFTGGVLAPNGKIYGIPKNATYVLIIKTSLPTLLPWMLAPEFNKL